MSYQSFDDRPGDSPSRQKLRRLQIPDMKGKTFLDVGCNEGFFCDAALKNGAARVVGLDNNHQAIELARKRFPDVDFRCGSWDTFLDGPFDVILHSSALHYAADPYAHVKRLRNALSDGGLLILECGVSTLLGQLWEKAERGVGTVYYPTESLLMNDLLADFSVRFVGESVSQQGDAIPRKVYHCRSFRPIALMISGHSGAGKTTLAYEFSRKGVATFSSDYFLEVLVRNAGKNEGALWVAVRTHLNRNDARPFYQQINDSDLCDKFAEEVAAAVPRGQRIVAIEGYPFGLPNIKLALFFALRSKGFFVHNIFLDPQ